MIFISYIDLKSVAYLHVALKMEEIKEWHRATLKNQDGKGSLEQLDILLIPTGNHLQNLIKSLSNCFKIMYMYMCVCVFPYICFQTYVCVFLNIYCHLVFSQ